MNKYSDFYKDKFFDVLKEDMTRMEIKINMIQETVGNIEKTIAPLPEIKSRVEELNGLKNRIYGIAGAISFGVSILGLWFKDKIWK